jgi:imidazolonepropionase-like amidohydrolase
MKRTISLACLAAAFLALTAKASAQDVAITNVRIVVGTGSVIESGTIVVRGGKIASVGPGTVSSSNPQGVPVINGAGMTAVPGYIDGHKHVNNFNADQMRSLLEAGTTTVLAGGGPAEQNLALAEHITKGEWIGPRVIPSGTINLRQTPAEARAAVQALAKMGV